MATRNVTSYFIEERQKRHGTRQPVSSGNWPGRDSAGLLENEMHIVNVPIDTPPAWVETVDHVKELDCTIQRQIAALRELHSAHLKPRFGKDEEAEERHIEELTDDIKQLFRKGDTAIRRLIANEGELANRKPDDQKLLQNVQISLVTLLSDRSKEFQEQHRKYANEVKKQRARAKKLVGGMNNRSAIDEEQERDEKMQKYVAQGFSQEQIDALLLNEQMVNERDSQLQNIYSNIVDLHSMFKDLNALVIDQGTLLDRIDHNVEETKTQILKANKQLEATAKLAKKSKFVMIVMILVILIVAMMLALLLKVVI